MRCPGFWGKDLFVFEAIKAGGRDPLYDTELREIVVAREGRDRLHLVTNDHQSSAAEIAAL